jgi:hypothetical protein
MNVAIQFDEERNPDAVEAIIDTLLLAIIRGNPMKKGQRSREDLRLTDVKKSLFGIAPRRGASLGHDIPELVHMAKGYLADRGVPDFGPEYDLVWPAASEVGARSATQLAKEALEVRIVANPGYAPHNKEEKTRNLQQKFDREIQTWLGIAYDEDGVPNDVLWMHLRELEGLLRMLGMKIGNPADPARDLNRPI